MYWDLDTISGLAVHTIDGRTFYPATRVLGVREGSLWLTQDVTGSEDYDYEDVSPGQEPVRAGEVSAMPLTPYRLIELPLATVLRLDVETVADSDEDSLTELALECAQAS